MNESIPSAAGSYLLAIYLSDDQTPAVGALGQIEIRQGHVVYAGSARGPGGLRSRLTHHITPSNNPHWHIDYLSSAGVITEIWWTVSEQRLECQLAEHLPDLPPGGQLIDGFGASDCSCSSHLCWFPAQPAIEMLSEKIGLNFSKTAL